MKRNDVMPAKAGVFSQPHVCVSSVFDVLFSQSANDTGFPLSRE